MCQLACLSEDPVVVYIYLGYYDHTSNCPVCIGTLDSEVCRKFDEWLQLLVVVVWECYTYVTTTEQVYITNNECNALSQITEVVSSNKDICSTDHTSSASCRFYMYSNVRFCYIILLVKVISYKLPKPFKYLLWSVATSSCWKTDSGSSFDVVIYRYT